MSPTPSPRTGAEAPQRKKRRTLRDADAELDACRLSLLEAKRKLVLTARENAKMKVLLMKYMDKDNSLLSSSQLSGAESSQSLAASQGSMTMSPIAEAESAVSQSSQWDYTTVEEQESEESGLWASDLQAEDEDAPQDALLPVSQLSQVSHLSHLSELSSTSNLDEIISFLEAQDKDSDPVTRLATMQEECNRLRAQQAVVRVGVGVLLFSPQHPGCVLLGQRKGSHGEGTFSLPGGHLEMYESWEQCAVREVKEETDLDVHVESVRFAYVTNDPMEDEDKHYVTLLMQAEVTQSQRLRNMEPHKCDGWFWERWSSLRTRQDLFTPLLHVSRSTFTPPFLASQ